jgi:hypothetical protein
MEKTSGLEYILSMPIVMTVQPIQRQISGQQQQQVVISPPGSKQTTTTTTTSQTQQLINYLHLTYLTRLVNGLIEISDKFFTSKDKELSGCCLQIYNILINYLEAYYNPPVVKPLNNLMNTSQVANIYPFTSASSVLNQRVTTNTNINTNNNMTSSSVISSNTSSGPVSSINTLILDQQGISMQQQQIKILNHQANIRQSIFELFLRIRSDKNRRMMLKNRNNDSRKLFKSNYLMLTSIDPNLSKEEQQQCLAKCQLDYEKVLRLIEYCLDKELDWNVINRVLTDLPYVLQYEMDLIENSDFKHNIFNSEFTHNIYI